ncbi:sensor histidine kinase [Acutalibacter sp. 1XD8-33]|uniref:sensor histidine kinase n=1 Tax=Acutalibacter sp. 1XD8-33 TaxID=2320081 RepID=UPI001FAA2EC8|nr:ATP-binding protein [Acutalibacter sp. 1XD8-33]
MGLIGALLDKRIYAYQKELIQIHYDEVENMYREMRGWRHDFRSHLQAMKACAAKGDLAALEEYLEQLDRSISLVEPVVKTGNSMADAILNSKISLARARGITVRADADIPIAITTPPVDLCTIIGNLFDNAIEASMELPPEDRLIRVYMEMKGSQLYLSFMNFTAKGRQKKKGGRYPSTKGKGHGFGLMRIDSIIERHGGYLSRNSEDGAFSTEILLPQR